MTTDDPHVFARLIVYLDAQFGLALRPEHARDIRAILADRGVPLSAVVSPQEGARAEYIDRLRTSTKTLTDRLESAELSRQGPLGAPLAPRAPLRQQIEEREIRDALAGLIGLVQLVRNGGLDLESNHRFIEAVRVLDVLDSVPASAPRAPHAPNCAREILRHADDSAAYLSERCTCGSVPPSASARTPDQETKI